MSVATNKISKFHVFIKQIPSPVRFGSIVYFASIIGYNCFHAYSDSKCYLDKFRQNKLSEQEGRLIKDDWDAVKYGAKCNSGERFWNSIIWPISIANNIVPWIVLQLNK